MSIVLISIMFIVQTIYAMKGVQRFLNSAIMQSKKPTNVRDVCFGLFVNGLYGLGSGFTVVNFLITIISFYGIIQSNEKIEEEKKG